ncbi:mechanosensitive ion channel domain-containing protein [Swingsia samuiensis]|uniref:mechanosensitive ion channel domain-containing protein n=1 Tax=Swingsia samuiensis TaxID=1293412 RepID=UPI001C65EAAF|nr:mechanosensitive ion channel domain-containing protein [Swingsia samuiensis]
MSNTSHAATNDPIETTASKTLNLSDASHSLSWKNFADRIKVKLDQNSFLIKEIFNTLNHSPSNISSNELNILLERCQNIQKSMKGTIAEVQSYNDIFDDYLKIYGTKAEANEDPAITTQRNELQKVSQSIKSALMRSRLYLLQSQQLNSLITSKLSHLQNATLSKKSTSPLSLLFWQNLISETPQNKTFIQNDGALSHWPILISGVIGTLLLLAIFSSLALNLSKKIVPYHDLTSSTENNIKERILHNIILINLNGFICCAIVSAIWAIWKSLPFNGTNDLVTSLLMSSFPICGFLIGAGQLFFGSKGLLNDFPQKERATLHKANWILAINLLLLNLLRGFQTQGVFGHTLLELLEIIFTLSVSLSAVMTFRSFEKQNDLFFFAPPALGISTFITCISVLAILIGYIPFAFICTSWILIALSGLLIIITVGTGWRVFLERIFYPEGSVASHLRPLGISTRRLTQLSVLLSGSGNIFLFFLFISIIQENGNVNFIDIGSRLHALFVGNSIYGIPFSLDTILICLLFGFIASYLIRHCREWIRTQFFPTTRLDIGAQTSILSIFTYCAWTLVFLSILTIAGLSVQNLTWVVSALSVGIGFGLQSIVQNFVSGIILIAERPVRVGDIVEIGGAKGDIKRISIRATDINLSDGSTLIVPNSQFITSSIKNDTQAGSMSSITLNFQIPIEADIEKATALFMEVAAQRPEILSKPTPYTTVSALSSTSITMGLTFNIASARNASNVQSLILFDLFRRFHTENISLTTV